MSAKRNGDQYRSQQMKKNTVVVTSDGDVFGKDPSLCSIVEGMLSFSVALGRFIVRGTVPGATIKMVK